MTAVRNTRSFELGIGSTWSLCPDEIRLLATSEKVSSPANDRKLESENETIMASSENLSQNSSILGKV
jgi:hypothetical protein